LRYSQGLLPDLTGREQLINQILHRPECPVQVRVKEYLSKHLHTLGLVRAMEQPHIGKPRRQLGQRFRKTAGRFQSPPMRVALSYFLSKEIGL